MNAGQILAHRGLWSSPCEKNSLKALAAAIESGFGVETDFRDHDGRLVISHDPPRGPDLLAADDFFAVCAQRGGASRLALNIKADGLQDLLKAAIASAGVRLERIFAFDMSVPDALGYWSCSFPAYTRASQFEQAPAFLDQADGVWVDDFLGDFPQTETAAKYLADGLRVTLVSPELHRRDHVTAWDAIEAAGLHRHPRFEICTDLPRQAAERFEVEP